jgi:mannose-6-phosphate isomerase
VAVAGEVLLDRGRNRTGDWIYSFDTRGKPADERADLYTQAFAILGLAEAGRALGRDDFIAAAVGTRERLDDAWRDPLGGYRDGGIAPHPGRQNPHMHLLEAFLALHAATGAEDDIAAALTLGDLFMQRLLIQPDRIAEEFDTAWRPIAAAGAAPGHQFEWAWLLEQLRQSGGPDRASTAKALAAFAEGRGVDRAGFVVDLIGLDGSVGQTSARLWPQTERLKAALAGLVPRPRQAAAQALNGIGAYLRGAAAGAWRDIRFANGRIDPGPSPASSGYHVACALEAFIRAGDTPV